MGQTLPPATTGTTPSWLVNVVGNMQAQEDRNYASRLDGYKADCAQWVKDATVARASGMQQPPMPQPPSKTYYFDNGELGVGQMTITPDPGIPAPTLPTVLPAGTPGGPAPNAGFSSGADAYNNTQMAILQSIVLDLAAIKKAMGIGQ